MTEILQKAGPWTADKVLRFFGAAILEKKEGQWMLSKGNVAFWALLAHCLYTWSQVTAGVGRDVPEGELYTLWALIGYSGVKAGVAAWSQKPGAQTEGQAP